MGPYCMYCDRRCFVERQVPGRAGTILMATCAAGQDHDQIMTGYNHTSADNPHQQPTGSEFPDSPAETTNNWQHASVPAPDQCSGCDDLDIDDMCSDCQFDIEIESSHLED